MEYIRISNYYLSSQKKVLLLSTYWQSGCVYMAPLSILDILSQDP